MTYLQQLFGPYNLCARIAPGFLFLISVYLLKGYSLAKLQNNSIIYIAILIILSATFGFISSSIIKIVERCLWGYFGNPIILYLKRKEKTLYKELLNVCKEDNIVVACILKKTREDSKLFWKNVSYGFFRNSILLSFCCLYFSWSTSYRRENVTIFLFVIGMTFVSSFYYAQQAIESYREITLCD
ncbi:MAG: hypothetical protein J6P00_04635 [Acetobacter sp.]|nr:hypothetical protein [Acetobacter sp.]